MSEGFQPPLKRLSNFTKDLMPIIDDVEQKKRFKKKAYRPWNLLDEPSVDPTSPPTPQTKSLPEQTEAKVELKWSQSGVKAEPNKSQSEVKVEPLKRALYESGVKVETKLEPQVESKWSQCEVKVETKVEPIAHSSSIVGLQRKALVFLYDSCRFSGSKISPPFAIQNIADACATSISATKKALQRLEQKRFIYRTEYKDGRSGWTRYQLPDGIYNELLQTESGAKVESKWGQTRAKVGTKVEPEPEPSGPSSSSKDLDLITTTTGKQDDSSKLAPEWKAIDLTDLMGIRFGQSHVAQVAKQGLLSPEQFQESIYAFALDLEVNGKGREINGAPLNYFMGILRRGPYTPPANYESPQIRQKRLYLEAKEREIKQLADLESRLEAVEFEEWRARLSVEEKARCVPVTDFAKVGSPGHNGQLKQYFYDNVWPERKLLVFQSGAKRSEMQQ